MLAAKKVEPRTPDVKLAEIFDELRPYVLHAGEVLIESFEDGATGKTARIRFAEDEHPLKDLLTNGNGQTQGRVVQVIIIETDEKHSPVNQERAAQLRDARVKGGEWCQKFHVLISETEFHRWMYTKGLTALKDKDDATRKELVETTLRNMILGDTSSRYLDHDPELRERFKLHIWDPYTAWRNTRRG